MINNNIYSSLKVLDSTQVNNINSQRGINNIQPTTYRIYQSQNNIFDYIVTRYEEEDVRYKLYDIYRIIILDSQSSLQKNIELKLRIKPIETNHSYYVNILEMAVRKDAYKCSLFLIKLLAKKNLFLNQRQQIKFTDLLIKKTDSFIDAIIEKFVKIVNPPSLHLLVIDGIEYNAEHFTLQSLDCIIKRNMHHNFSYKYNPLIHAIHKNKLSIFKKTLKILPAFFLNTLYNNKTLVMEAVKNDDSAYLQILLGRKEILSSLGHHNNDDETALEIAIKNNKYDNARLLIESYPKLAFVQNKAGDTPLIIAFYNHQKYAQLMLENQYIRSQINNPLFFSDIVCSKNNLAYQKLIELRKKKNSQQGVSLDNKLLLTIKKSIKKNTTTLTNNNFRFISKNIKAIDYIAPDISSLKEYNQIVFDRVKRVLPLINNLAVYIKAKQYYDKAAPKQFFSYGDENASIALIDYLITLGVRKLKVIISAPDNSTREIRRSFSAKDKTLYRNKKKFCLQKLSCLFPSINSQTLNAQKINKNGCEITLGFVDDNRFMYASIPQNHVFQTRYNTTDNLLKHQGTIITFSANSVYTEIMPDNLLVIKPFSFSKAFEQLHTDIYFDKNNNSVTANISGLSNPNYSIIPEVTVIPHKIMLLNWIYNNLNAVYNSTLITNFIYSIYENEQKNKINHGIIYGLHHPYILPNAYMLIRKWIKILIKTQQFKKNAIVLSVFRNNINIDIDLILYDTPQAIFVNINAPHAVEDINEAIAEKKLILVVHSPLPKKIFNFLTLNSSLPMLTEGANTTSFLLQNGLPYLSILPNGGTKVPSNLGDNLQSFLVECLSYKLMLEPKDLARLHSLYSLAKEKNLVVARNIIDLWIKKARKLQIKDNLSFLWHKPITEKITAYDLISKEDKLGDVGYEVLLQALNYDIEAICNYIYKVINPNTKEHNHFKLMAYSINNSFNNAVITSLNKFFISKNLL